MQYDEKLAAFQRLRQIYILIWRTFLTLCRKSTKFLRFAQMRKRENHPEFWVVRYELDAYKITWNIPTLDAGVAGFIYLAINQNTNIARVVIFDNNANRAIFEAN